MSFVTEKESALDAIYGTKSYTGNACQDAEYAALKRIVENIENNEWRLF